MSVDTKRARELAGKYRLSDGRSDIEVSEQLEALADEVERLREENEELKRRNRKEMDEDLFWAVSGKHKLMEERETKWEPLLAAAKEYEADYAILGEVGDVGRRLRERIAACEEE